MLFCKKHVSKQYQPEIRFEITTITGIKRIQKLYSDISGIAKMYH